MKILALNSNDAKPLVDAFEYFLSLPREKRYTLYRERGYTNLLEVIPHTVYPCGLVFSFTTIKEGIRIRDHLSKMIHVYPEQTLIEITPGVFCSGPLLIQLGENPQIPSPDSWKYKKALVFRSWELVREIRLPAGTRAAALSRACTPGEKVIEVLCLEWEYFDKHIIYYWYEWGGECFWSGNLKTDRKYGSPISPDKLPLSDRTKKRVMEMIERHESFIGRLGYSPRGFDSEKTEEDYRQFSDAASELLPVLREELGGEYVIIPD